MPPTVKRKIAMLGGFSVGKTSLVSTFVRSMFSEKYQTTVGVRVDKKDVSVDNDRVTLLIWDLHGEDNIFEIPATYLRGSAGYLLVVDGTRPETLKTACGLKDRVQDLIGPTPFVLLLNKSDLAGEWKIDESALTKLKNQGWHLIKTSAKTGAGVEDAFTALARAMLRTSPP